MIAKPGDRVGAIFGGKERGRLEVFGEGTYEGDFAYGDGDDDPVGQIADIVRTLPPESRPKNPRIRLDSGGVVWGCECWWCPVEKYQSYLDAATEVVEVNIDEIREKYRREAAENLS
jgi:hypothetical protein